jgi:hypothetical protein
VGATVFMLKCWPVMVPWWFGARSMVVFPDSCPCWRHADLLSIGALSGLYIAYYIIVIMRGMISYPPDLYVP